MDFATWAKENPTLTGEYQALVDRRNTCLKYLREYEGRLAKALAGEYEHKPSIGYMFEGLMNEAFEAFKFHAVQDEDESPELKQLRDEQEKLEKQINDRREYEMHLDSEIYVCEQEIAKEKERLEKYNQDISTFKFHLLERHSNVLYDDQHLVNILNQRIGALWWGEVDADDMIIAEAIDFVDQIPDAQFSLLYRDLVHSVTFKLNEAEYSAHDTDRIPAVLNAWIDFVEANWELLVKEFTGETE